MYFCCLLRLILLVKKQRLWHTECDWLSAQRGLFFNSSLVLLTFIHEEVLFSGNQRASQLHWFTALFYGQNEQCVIWEEFEGRGMAASICGVRGGPLISVSEPPTPAELDRGNTVKWEEKRGLLYSSREPVLMAQSFYEGLRIRVGVFLNVWLVGRKQSGTDWSLSDLNWRLSRLCSAYAFFFVCLFCIIHAEQTLQV